LSSGPTTTFPSSGPAPRPPKGRRPPRPFSAPSADDERASLAARIDRALAGALVRLVARLYLRKPDTAELLATKIPTLRAVAHAIGNEVGYLLRLPVSHRLTSVNIEITNACNLACTMCPVNTTMRRPKRMMPMRLFEKILDENPGIQFLLPFQWGEPTLHRDFYRMVALARSRGVRVMATTNGTFLDDDEEAVRLATCGLERVTFSSDGIGDTHTRIRGFPWEKLRANVVRFREVRNRLGSPTRIDVSMVLWDETREEIPRLLEAWRGIADRVQVVPRLVAGGRSRACRELWRGTLTVLADGTVVPCCVDAEGELRVGDARNEPLRKIWNGPAMRELRRRHRRGAFPGPCDGCDEYEHTAASKRFR